MKFRFPWLENSETKSSQNEGKIPEYNLAGQLVNGQENLNLDIEEKNTITAQAPENGNHGKKRLNRREKQILRRERKQKSENIEPKHKTESYQALEETLTNTPNIQENVSAPRPHETEAPAHWLWGSDTENQALPPPIELLEELVLTPEQEERLVNQANDIIAEEAQTQLAHSPDLTLEQKTKVTSPQAREEIKKVVEKKRFLGQAAVEALVGFTSGVGGTVAIKMLAGYGLRSTLKRMVDIGAPGMGFVVGAAVGAGYEAIKTTVQEKKRVGREKEEHTEKIASFLLEEYKLELSGLSGEDRFKKLIEIKVVEGNKAFLDQAKVSELFLKHKNSKVNKGLILKNTLQGGVIGGVGGTIGGWAAEKLFGVATAVHAAGSEHAASHVSTPFEKGLSATAGKVVEGKIEASVSGQDITTEAKTSAWAAVKKYIIDHKVKNVTNALVNEATRKITDLNNIEITSDYLSEAGKAAHHHMASGTKDILMHAGDKLHHMEALNELIVQHGGTPEMVNVPVNIHAPSGIPHIGYLETPMHTEGGFSYENLKNIGYIVGGIAAGGAARKLWNRRKEANSSRAKNLENPNNTQELAQDGEINGEQFAHLVEASAYVDKAEEALAENKFLEVMNLHLRAGVELERIKTNSLKNVPKGQLWDMRRNIEDRIKLQKEKMEAAKTPQPAQQEQEQEPKAQEAAEENKVPENNTEAAEAEDEKFMREFLDLKLYYWSGLVESIDQEKDFLSKEEINEYLSKEADLWEELENNKRFFSAEKRTKKFAKEWEEKNKGEIAETNKKLKQIHEYLENKYPDQEEKQDSDEGGPEDEALKERVLAIEQALAEESKSFHVNWLRSKDFPRDFIRGVIEKGNTEALIARSMKIAKVDDFNEENIQKIVNLLVAALSKEFSKTSNLNAKPEELAKVSKSVLNTNNNLRSKRDLLIKHLQEHLIVGSTENKASNSPDPESNAVEPSSLQAEENTDVTESQEDNIVPESQAEKEKAELAFSRIEILNKALPILDAQIQAGKLDEAEEALVHIRKERDDIVIHGLVGEDKYKVADEKHALNEKIKEKAETIKHLKAAKTETQDIQVPAVEIQEDAQDTEPEEVQTKSSKKHKQASFAQKVEEKGVKTENANTEKLALLLRGKKDGGTLWKVVGKGELSQAQAEKIQENLWSVKDWSSKNIDLSQLVEIFSTLNKVKQSNKIKLLLSELLAVSPVMQAAKDQAEKFKEQPQEELAAV